MRIFIFFLTCSFFLIGCNESKAPTKVIGVWEYTTVGLGPESYRKEIIKKLKAAGIPVVEGPPRENGVADISWPKEYDELAYSIYGGPPKLVVPKGGGILNLGQCQSTGLTIQTWQTVDAIWLVKLDGVSVEGTEITSLEASSPITNISELSQAKDICSDLTQQFLVVLPNPKDSKEVNTRLTKLEVHGKVIEAKDGYFYWSK